MQHQEAATAFATAGAAEPPGGDEGGGGCSDSGSDREAAAAVTIQTAWREWKRSDVGNSPAAADFWTSADRYEGDAEDAEESAPPTLATSGYMTNSLSSCFSDLRASHTQDSLLAHAVTSVQQRQEAETGDDTEGETIAEPESETMSERAQWRALEQRLAELAERRRKKAPQLRHYKQQQHQANPHASSNRSESERERVLRALSSCYSEDELLPPVESEPAQPQPGCWQNYEAAAAASSAGSAASTMHASAGMELCFRNDAASDEDDEEGGDDGLPDTQRRRFNGSAAQQGKQKWQRFRRPPKNFVPSATTELTRPMQLCFISDPTSDEDEIAVATSSASVATPSSSGEASDATTQSQMQSPLQQPQQPTVRKSRRPLEPELLVSLGLGPDGRGIARDDEDENDAADLQSNEAGEGSCGVGLRRRQAQLQAEAQLALAQAEPMARMQLEVERHMQELRHRDALAELLGVASSKRLGEARLEQMSLGALQLVHNSLLARIEGHNGDLVRCLMERDELHMEQDSMLVEIEDLTRRAQEAEASRQAAAAAVAAAAVPGGLAEKSGADSRTTPVRRRMSLLTARLKPNKLVSLFTGT